MAKCDCQTGFFPYVRVEIFEGEGKKNWLWLGDIVVTLTCSTYVN